jgi:hypothetical protein
VGAIVGVAVAILVASFGALSLLSRPPKPQAVVDAGAKVVPAEVVEVVDASVPVVVMEPDASVPAVAEIPDAGKSAPLVSRQRAELPVAPPTAEQAELLSRANGAFSRSEWTEVVELTQKPSVIDRPEAVTLRILAWCHLGNLGLVNAYKARLPASKRASVSANCRQLGVDFN